MLVCLPTPSGNFFGFNENVRMDLVTTPFEDLILGSQFLPLLAWVENGKSGVESAVTNVGVLQCRQCQANFLQVREALTHYKLHVFESHKQHFTVVVGIMCPHPNCPVMKKNAGDQIHFHCTYCSFTATEILELPIHMESGHLAFYREVSLVLRGDDVQLKKVYTCGECGKKIQGTVSIVQHLLEHDCDKTSSGSHDGLGTPIYNGNSDSPPSYQEETLTAKNINILSSNIDIYSKDYRGVKQLNIPTILNVPGVEIRNQRAVIISPNEREKLDSSNYSEQSSFSFVNPNTEGMEKRNLVPSKFNDSETMQEIINNHLHSDFNHEDNRTMEVNPLDLLTTVMDDSKQSDMSNEHFLLGFSAPSHFLAGDDGQNGYTEDNLNSKDAEDSGDVGEKWESDSYFECPGMFTCDECHELFKFSYLLLAHKRLVHQGLELPFVCPACDLEFGELTDLKSHIIKHSGDTFLQCLICQQTFSDKASLKLHSSVHSVGGDRNLKCDSCGLGFPSKSELTCHIVKYQGTCNPNKTESVRCATCGEEVINLEALKEHRRTVHPTPHDQAGTSRRGFQCDYCGKTFNCRSNLRDHLVVHTGEKPYPCDICGKAFSFVHNMKTHRLTHNEGRNEVCPYCDKAYKSKISLYYHMKKGNCRGLASTQVPEGYHRCTECLQMFASEERYKIHKEKGHCQMSYMCSNCGVRCSSQQRLDKHIEKGICNKSRAGSVKRRNSKSEYNKNEFDEEIVCERCNYAKDCCCTFSCQYCNKRIFSILAYTLHKKKSCPSIRQRREKFKAAVLEKRQKREEELSKLALESMEDEEEKKETPGTSYEGGEEENSSGSLMDLSTFALPNSLSSDQILDIEKHNQ